MRIAYLFHGHSRTWRECYQSFFDNVYSVAPGDIFIHTWDRVNSKYGSWWNGTYNNFLKNEHAEISSKTINVDDLIKTYNPKHIIVETDPGVEFAFSKYPQLQSTGYPPAHVGVYNMFKSQHDVYQLTIPYGSYDRYFSCRFDLCFHNKLDYTELEDTTNLMISPNSGPHNVILDFFAFGTQDIMSIRSNFHSHMWDYWYSKSDINAYGIEGAIGKYYSDNNIYHRESGLNFDIKRLF
jgi:hypothetical protein